MNENFQNFNAKNFDPNALANLTSTVIIFITVIDVSPSIAGYVTEMNTSTRDLFMQELKNSHRKDDIVVKTILFNDQVEHKSGFMPIVGLPDNYMEAAPSGSGTALYQA